MANRNLVIAMILFFLFIGTIIFALLPQYHFWKSDYERSSDWCKINKPQLNLSLSNERIAFCYGEGWGDYCKISYPNYCPEGVNPFDDPRQTETNGGSE